MTDSCPRTPDVVALVACVTCGAYPTEECPFTTLTPGLLESKPVTAGVAGDCDAADGVCESCQ